MEGVLGVNKGPGVLTGGVGTEEICGDCISESVTPLFTLCNLPF